MESTCASPRVAVVGKFWPSWTPSKTLAPAPRPIIRLTQPERSDDPGSAFSTSSMAAKCDRLTIGSPVAWMAASSPEAHSGASGDIAGCSPNIGSAQTSAEAATAVVGLTR